MSAEGNTDNAEPARFAGRFVILTHDHPFVHWDLMLEAGDTLRTWRLLAEPRPDLIMTAQPLPDHRLHYLDYEGPVSGGRGTVARWDQGRHSTEQTTAQTTVTLTSDRLGHGRFVLRPHPQDGPWTCVFASDASPQQETGV